MPLRMAMVILLMGVAGVGKSVIGRELADRLGWTFLDADDDHSAASVAKMRAGEALSEADRAPWLVAVRERLRRHVDRGENVVLACSALKASYRATLAEVGGRFEVVHLIAPASLIQARLRERRGHFAGAELLPDQIEDLEPPADAVVVDASPPVDEVIETIRARVGV
ncbi:MAG TPA: gluconokinase, GntK/IdnK-type [Longimicrobiales bacterium]|nr:gluconokinase, GntK/IdnK-type [Longimicrobiales bacterium]